jgi:hypothetical protein
MRGVDNISNIVAKKELIDKIRESLNQKKTESNDSKEIEFLLKRL